MRPAENNAMTPAERERRITHTSYVGIGANLLLAGFKAAVGLTFIQDRDIIGPR